MRNRVSSTIALLALTAVALSGCVTVTTAAPVTNPSGVPAAPATTSAAPEPTEAEPSPPEGTETDPAEQPSTAPSETTGTTTAAGPDVSLAPESGTLYLHPIQAFSPKLEAWVVDHETGELGYTRYTCLGTTEAAGVGALEPRNEDTWLVTWGGTSPMRLSNGPTVRLQITDSTVVYSGDVASTQHDIELEQYLGMCQRAGETAVGFVL